MTDPTSTDGRTEEPLYVIVERRVSRRQVRGTVIRSARELVYDVHPDDDLADVTERAADLQHNAQTRYGRPEDTYWVAELRRVPVVEHMAPDHNMFRCQHPSCRRDALAAAGAGPGAVSGD